MDIERLTYMANQIAKNLASNGQDEAARLTAQHMLEFWEPRMLGAIHSADPATLLPIAEKAVQILTARTN